MKQDHLINVVLVGDSIRRGYQETVSRELEGWARVWGPEENGGTSVKILSHLDEWVIRHQPEVLHINCGLHDLKKAFGQTDAKVPLDTYADNLRKIITRVQKETGAVVIWALTTPVNEVWHHRKKSFDRFEKDVAAYNKVASEVVREMKVETNDLFALVTNRGRDELLLPDGVHFKPEGYALLGKAVADSIRRAASDRG